MPISIANSRSANNILITTVNNINGNNFNGGYEVYTINKTVPTINSTKYSGEFQISTNTTIYYAYSDGTNVGNVYGSVNVTNIDTTKPTISTALNSSAITTKGFTINVGVTDSSSGLSKITWYYKLSTASSYENETNTYTAMNGSTAGTRTAITKSKTYTNLLKGTYNAYAVVYDVAGNSTETSKIDITLETIETASGGTYAPTYYTNAGTVVTLPTKSGFTTVYTIDKTVPKVNSTAGGRFTATSNMTI